MGATKKKRKTMTMAEAAHRILLKAGAPMHYRKITEKALKSGMIVTAGKTPEQSLRSLLATEYIKKGSKSRFRPKGSGLYTLTAYGRKTAPGAFKKAKSAPAKRAGSKSRKRCK